MSGIASILNTDLLVATIRLSTPITLAAIGATICERSGIVNIAMEGIMIIGAFFAAVAALYTGNPWIGLLAGVAAGGIFSLIHAVATITFHLDHVVSGAVMNILSFGIVRYLMVMIFGHPGTSDAIPVGLKAYQFAIPGLSKRFFCSSSVLRFCRCFSGPDAGFQGAEYPFGDIYHFPVRCYGSCCGGTGQEIQTSESRRY